MGLNLCIEDRKSCKTNSEKFGNKNKIISSFHEPELKLNQMFIGSRIYNSKNNINSKIKKYKRKIRILEKQLIKNE